MTDADLTAGIDKMAAANGKSVDELRKQIVDNGHLESYKEQLKAEKALDLVLAEAK